MSSIRHGSLIYGFKQFNKQIVFLSDLCCGMWLFIQPDEKILTKIRWDMEKKE